MKFLKILLVLLITLCFSYPAIACDGEHKHDGDHVHKYVVKQIGDFSIMKMTTSCGKCVDVAFHNGRTIAVRECDTKTWKYYPGAKVKVPDEI